MAIYEYSCQKCGHHFQERRAMKDADAPIECPKCGNKDTKRALSLFFAAGGEGALKGAGGGGGSCSSCGGGSCSSCGH
ncbi:MAG: zinc ribbon domain-containing protein [Anaerolineae bacterium]|nr:zinc ribbon domain-containing protein [Anaerolineae bacterium]